MWRPRPLITAFCRQQQEKLCEFKASLVYKVPGQGYLVRAFSTKKENGEVQMGVVVQGRSICCGRLWIGYPRKLKR